MTKSISKKPLEKPNEEPIADKNLLKSYHNSIRKEHKFSGIVSNQTSKDGSNSNVQKYVPALQ